MNLLNARRDLSQAWNEQAAWDAEQRLRVARQALVVRGAEALRLQLF